MSEQDSGLRTSQLLISRRRFLAGLSLLPAGFMAACGAAEDATSQVVDAMDGRKAEPTATPEPFVVAAGASERLLMAGTPQETPALVVGSGLPGKVLMVLGGVHGNEPGGWLAAEELRDSFLPQAGAIIVVPRANKLAVRDFVRTTEDLGDLNRLYPGRLEGLPMARMALELVELMREFRVNVVVDMHESWAFYKDRPQSGTAYLGQTVATYPAEPGLSLGRDAVEAVNRRILSPIEEFFFRQGGTNPNPPPNSPQAATPVVGSSSSSLGLPRHLPGLAILLVEMGQQQPLERRIAMHVDMVHEVAWRIGVSA
jgi:hypothetical protein